MSVRKVTNVRKSMHKYQGVSFRAVAVSGKWWYGKIRKKNRHAEYETVKKPC